mgnify:CR=1 FL=1|jgi:hypothetical protein
MTNTQLTIKELNLGSTARTMFDSIVFCMNCALSEVMNHSRHEFLGVSLKISKTESDYLNLAQTFLKYLLCSASDNDEYNRLLSKAMTEFNETVAYTLDRKHKEYEENKYI